MTPFSELCISSNGVQTLVIKKELCLDMLCGGRFTGAELREDR